MYHDPPEQDPVDDAESRREPCLGVPDEPQPSPNDWATSLQWGRFFTESLQSLLGQTYDDFELIISDNTSQDSTADICKQYSKVDSRIRYIRQDYNIGLVRNEQFVMRQAAGELFKLAAHDDLYARELLKKCVEALDAHPKVVVAHCWEARIDTQGWVVEAMKYSVAVDRPQTPERFRSMLFDGWDDYTYGVMRTEVLLRTHLCGSHHMADRSINVELSLYGPFYLVPEWLYFRREHAGMATALRLVQYVNGAWPSTTAGPIAFGTH